MDGYRLVFLIFLLTNFNHSVSEHISVESLVNRLDEVRGYRDQGFTFNITNISYKKNREPRSNKLNIKVYNNKSLIYFQSPARERGRAMLKENTNMWLYIPGTRRLIRVAPSQRLLGETSNGDVVGASFSTNYDAKIYGEESIVGNEYWVLKLTAKYPSVTYSSVKVWMEKYAGNKPFKSEFYSRSKRLLKTAYYKEYKFYEGELKLHKLLLVDALMKDSYTWMRFDNYRLEVLDAAIFQKESLGRLN